MSSLFDIVHLMLAEDLEVSVSITNTIHFGSLKNQQPLESTHTHTHFKIRLRHENAIKCEAIQCNPEMFEIVLTQLGYYTHSI